MSIESLKAAGVINVRPLRNLPQGARRPGEMAAGVKVHAAAFSESAKAKIEAAGGSVEVVPGRKKWSAGGAANA